MKLKFVAEKRLAVEMLVRIKEHGVIVLCKKGADGEYLEEGITLEAA